MSTIQTRVSSLQNGQRLDRAEFHERYAAMPSGTRAELIEGIVRMPSPLSNDHGEANFPLVVWIDHYLEKTPGLRGAINASTLLDDRAEPQPDVLVRIPAESGGSSRLENGFIVGPPELVVEIARASRATDLGSKKTDYERAGVAEYLVVELEPDRIHWFALRQGRFQVIAPGADGISRSEIFPGLWLDADALFHNDRARLRAVVDQGVATAEHARFEARLRNFPGGL